MSSKKKDEKRVERKVNKLAKAIKKTWKAVRRRDQNNLQRDFQNKAEAQKQVDRIFQVAAAHDAAKDPILYERESEGQE